MLHPTTAFLLAMLALVLVWELCAWFLMPYGFTISERVWAWSLVRPWVVRSAYLALVAAGYLHFFGLSRPY